MLPLFTQGSHQQIKINISGYVNSKKIISQKYMNDAVCNAITTELTMSAKVETSLVSWQKFYQILSLAQPKETQPRQRRQMLN
jgi:hypothetical protein